MFLVNTLNCKNEFFKTLLSRDFSSTSKRKGERIKISTIHNDWRNQTTFDARYFSLETTSFPLNWSGLHTDI